jgi:hypothetical protein
MRIGTTSGATPWAEVSHSENRGGRRCRVITRGPFFRTSVGLALAGAVFLHAAPSAAMTLELLEDASGALADAGGLLDIVAGPNAIVISTNGSSVLASKDGASWRTVELSPDIRGAVLAYTNGRFWASYEGGMCTSTDGFDWSCATTGMTSFTHLTFGNGHYLAAERSYLYTSTDGATWTQIAAPLEDASEFGSHYDYGLRWYRSALRRG